MADEALSLHQKAMGRSLVGDRIDGLWEDLHGLVTRGRISDTEFRDALSYFGLPYDAYESWLTEATVNGQI